MPAIGVTYIQVAEAAESIRKEGLNPTVERVRKHLGTGSNTTINEHLRAWKLDAARIGADMPLDLLKAVNKIIERAELAATNEFEKDKQSLQLKLDEAHAVIDRYSEQIATLEGVVEAEKLKNEGLASDITELTEAHQESISSLQETNRALSVKCDELSGKNQKLADEKETLHVKLSAAAEESAKRLADLHAQHMSDINALHDKHDNKVDSIKQEYVEAMDAAKREHADAMQVLRQDYEKQIQTLDTRIRSLISEQKTVAETHREEVAEIKTALTQTQDAANKAKNELANLKGRTDGLKASVEEIKKERDMAREKEKALEIENSKLKALLESGK